MLKLIKSFYNNQPEGRKLKELRESYKGIYLFRLGTTSFIYPDLYSENVKKLGPYIDEVELLFFESKHPDSIPDDYEIKELVRLKKELDITYNVHLPTDVTIAAANPNERKIAVEALSKIIEKTAPLDPVTYTLHIPFEDFPGGKNVWQAYAFKGLRTLLQNGMDPSRISVETLDYAPDLLADIVSAFGLSVCLDIGHLIVNGYDPLEVFHTFKDHVSIIHLHGVYKGNDHVSLHLLSEKDFLKVRTILQDYNRSLSIEVFSYNDLERSLSFFKDNL